MKLNIPEIHQLNALYHFYLCVLCFRTWCVIESVFLPNFLSWQYNDYWHLFFSLCSQVMFPDCGLQLNLDEPGWPSVQWLLGNGDDTQIKQMTMLIPDTKTQSTRKTVCAWGFFLKSLPKKKKYFISQYDWHHIPQKSIIIFQCIHTFGERAVSNVSIILICILSAIWK